MPRRSFFSRLAGVIVAALAVSAGPARGQQVETSASAPALGALAEVVVTAERRSADVQKTAVSVAVRSGDEMVKEGKATLLNMLEDVAGVTVTPMTPTIRLPNDNPGLDIVIRGVRPNTGPPTDTQVATTALYTDGIYGGIGADFDLDRVEILRGPQGTLYGRSATGGVVSISTRDPVLGAWSGAATAEYGSYALQHLSAAVNIPASDQLAVRVSGNVLQQNGFLGAGGRHKTGAGRVKVLYQPSADFSLLVGGAVQGDSTETGGPTTSLTAPNTIVVNAPFNPSAVAAINDVFRQVWAKLDWNLGFGTLTYMPALRTYANDSPYRLAYPFFTQSVTQDYAVDQIHTEELRLASNAGAPVSWITGAWFYKRLYNYTQDATWQPSGGYSHGPHIQKDTTNGAVFGELTLPIADTWRVTGGLRYDYTRIDSFGSTYTLNHNEGSCGGVFFPPMSTACTAFSANYSLPSINETFVLPKSDSLSKQNNLTYKVRVEKDLTPANLLYAMAASGFLPADITIGNSGPTPATQTIHSYPYESENVRSYEIGSKNRLLNDTLQINGAGFYYNYSGYQTIVNIAGGGPAPNNVMTAAPARMFGAELEAIWQATPSDRLTLSASHVHARFVDKPAFFAIWVAQDTIPGVPPTTAQAGYDHRFGLPNSSALTVGADALYTSSYDESIVAVANFAILQPYVHLGAKTVGNVHATWSSTSDKYSVTGYVRNVSDTRFKTGATVNGIGPGGSIINNVFVNAPRVYGVVLSATF